MTRSFIPFLTFCLLLLLTIPFSPDFATSVVPGWHTTIFPPYFVWSLVVTTLLILATIGYWIIYRRLHRTNWTMFVVHLLLTIPAIIDLKFPSILSGTSLANQTQLWKIVDFQAMMTFVIWMLFIVGQILFLVYFIRAVKQKKDAVH